MSLKLPPVEFECVLSESDQSITLTCSVLHDWLQTCASNKICIEKIVVQSVDLVGADAKRRVLFLKLKATAFDPDGRPLPGVCLLRGHAVAVLPILNCEGRDHALLVRQARLPAGLPDCLEIPAGMCDGHPDPAEVAIRELEEETGLCCAKEELQELLPEVNWIDASPGLLDEGVRLYLIERRISLQELALFQGRNHGKEDEREYIQLEVLEPRQAMTRTKDSKTLLALAAYLLRKSQS